VSFFRYWRADAPAVASESKEPEFVLGLAGEAKGNGRWKKKKKKKK
jgi:hypothetical protein